MQAELVARPKLGRQRLSRVQKAGLAYERRVLGEAKSFWFPGDKVLHNPWIKYGAAGRYCCPDIVVLQRSAGWLLECKLSWRGDAAEKVLGLYLPLCRALWPRATWRAAGVCRYWKGEAFGLPFARPDDLPAAPDGLPWILWG